MAFKATQDTYAFERVGPDTMVRRQVFAGQDIPEGWFADEEGTQPLEGDKGVRAGGLGAAPHAYKHQLDENGQIADEQLQADAEAQTELNAAEPQKATRRSNKESANAG